MCIIPFLSYHFLQAEVCVAKTLLSCFEFEEANEILSLRLPQISAMLGPENKFTLHVKDLYSNAKKQKLTFLKVSDNYPFYPNPVLIIIVIIIIVIIIYYHHFHYIYHYHYHHHHH